MTHYRQELSDDMRLSEIAAYWLERLQERCEELQQISVAYEHALIRIAGPGPRSSDPSTIAEAALRDNQERLRALLEGIRK